MKVENRLKLIGMLPALLLMILSGYFFMTSYQNIEKAKGLKATLFDNSKITHVLTEVGKERGLSSMYYGSNQNDFLNPLEKQRKKTDYSFDTLKNISIPNTKELSTIRHNIDDDTFTFTQMFLAYTKDISSPLAKKLLQINQFSFDAHISSFITALSELYIAKENTTLERDFFSYFMINQTAVSFSEIALWDTFKTQTNTTDVKHIHNDHLQKQLDIILSNAALHPDISLVVAPSSALPSQNRIKETIDWFALQSQKIYLFTKAELLISNRLWQENNTYIQKQRLLLGIAIASMLLGLLLLYLSMSTARQLKKRTYNTNAADESLKVSTPTTEKKIPNDYQSHTKQKKTKKPISTPREVHKTPNTTLSSTNIANSGHTPDITKNSILSSPSSFVAQVLLVTKDTQEDQMIKSMLEPYNIRVDVAHNGLEAFEKRRTHTYNLIFMDMDLPVMQGKEVAQEIMDYEKDGHMPHVPIVALIDNLQPSSLPHGINAFLHKPIQADRLQDILNTFLSEKERLVLDSTVEKASHVNSYQEKKTSLSQTQTTVITPKQEERVIKKETPLPTPTKILVAKKFALEQKILTKILDNLGYTYTPVNNKDDLHYALRSNEYGIIFTDNDFLDNELLHAFNHLSIITARQSKDQIKHSIETQRAKYQTI